MVNLSLSQGIFPIIYKTTIVTPLFKTGEKLDVNNYRPISLTSNIAKIFEKIVKK